VSIPAVSVVLPVRDGEPFLRPALESVLNQSFADFEVVAVDDGSTDATGAILADTGDVRLRVVRQDRRGLVAALARGIAETRGRYVARMDADDVSLPRRFERQAAVLDADERTGVVGCGVETIDERGRVVSARVLPPGDAPLRRRLLLRNPFAHGSVMIRRDALERAGGYRADYGANEDYDLWRRIAREWRLGAVPEVLYRYREHAAAVTKIDRGDRVDARERLRDELWADPAFVHALGVEREPAEARALLREALRRRRYAVAIRALPGAVRPATSA
jgi:glycosyltransferase involved in cell wall biosynthesis